MKFVVYDSRIQSFSGTANPHRGGGSELIPAGQFITTLTEQDKQTCIHLYRKLEEPIYLNTCYWSVEGDESTPRGEAGRSKLHKMLISAWGNKDQGIMSVNTIQIWIKW